MKNIKNATLGTLAGAMLLAGQAMAAPIVPTFDTFGTLAGATFGGSGIPNDAVAITTIGGATAPAITLGLTAHQRFFNPPLGNDGAGTFFAGPGANFGGPGNPSALLGTLWSVGTYISYAGGIGNLDITYYYDFDPGKGTDESALGSIDIDALLNAQGAGGLTLAEDSNNLLFSFFGTAVPGVISPPAGSFDPNAAGEYSFALVVRDQTGAELGRSAILVNVPEPGTLALLGLGLGLVGIGMRRRKA